MSAFMHSQYLLKRQTIALTGKFRIYDPQGNLVLYSYQKMFKLKEDIRVYADEQSSQELMVINARNIIDFGATYDVTDSMSGQLVGSLRRKGLKSIVRDEWEVLNPEGQVFATVIEDSMGLALLRRFLTNLVPQNYDILMNGERVGDLRQNFNPFTYRLTMDFSMDTANRFDRRLGIAAGVLLGTIERRQQDYD